jgi:hypothetical protein
MIVWSNAAGTLAKFRLDGKEYPYTDGQRTISFRHINKNTLESIDRRDGKIVAVFVMTFDADGKTRTVVQKGVDDKKSNAFEIARVSTRVGGPTDPITPLVGRWANDWSSATGTRRLHIQVTGDEISVSGLHTYKAKLDGKEYPVEHSPIADTVGLRRLDDRTMEQTLKSGGRVVTVSKLLVSADGQTLTMNIRRGNNSTTTNVFVRE